MRLFLLVLSALSVVGPAAGAQRSAPTRPAALMSAPISNVRYTVRFDRTTAPMRQLHVTMTFATSGRDPVLLSLPAWTPGAYELSFYARKVNNFRAEAGGRALDWDKVDFDTWRIVPGAAATVTVSFSFGADSLDNAMAWSKPDFAFFNGTNVFPWAEGRGTDFPATVSIQSESDWQVATGMAAAAGPRTYAAKNYHDLVDMPFFVGALDVDSAEIAGKWVRTATYPRGMLQGAAREQFWDHVRRMIPPMVEVFDESPHDSYTNLIVFDSSYGGGSALEHQNSHVGIYTPLIIGNPLLASITAHEIFHLWNVKRMRPAEMVPYQYDRAQPTPWLWVSEGITDYYADLALVRGGIIDSAGFLELTMGKVGEVGELPAVALEDASLSTWIHPTDGTHYIYYPKGSLAGFLLDILIRDASDNQRSLDDVMKEVYTSTYKAGRGFTAQDWWGAVSRAAGGKSFAEVNERHIDGREPFPWASVLPLAGLRLNVDSIREPRIGVFTIPDSAGVRVTEVEPNGAAAEAGVRPGDLLVQVGEIAVTDATFGARFRARYGQREGTVVPLTVRRNEETLTLNMPVRIAIRTVESIVLDRNASPKALRIRQGIVTGGNRQ
jgi:predicted metalloprotease with PDZ domain